MRLSGESGKGKSTLAKIIASLYNQKSGVLRLFGKDYGDISLKSLRQEIMYVPQNFHIFHDTIFENIRMWNEPKTIDDVRKAAKLACIDNYIASLPQGYDTLVTDNGENLSLGERQRLAIARALCRGAGILILDEIVANIDIENVLFEKGNGKTVIAISHASRNDLYDRVITW